MFALVTYVTRARGSHALSAERSAITPGPFLARPTHETDYCSGYTPNRMHTKTRLLQRDQAQEGKRGSLGRTVNGHWKEHRDTGRQAGPGLIADKKDWHTYITITIRPHPSDQVRVVGEGET